MRKLIRIGRAAGNVRRVMALARQQQAEREAAELARARRAAQGDDPIIPARRLFLAGAIDQWLIWGSVLCFLGLAIWQFSVREEHTAFSTAASLAPIFLSPAFWPLLLGWTLRHYDTTAGMFVLGIHYGPRRKADLKESSFNHLGLYWGHLLQWRRDRSSTLNDAGQPGAVLVDRRAHSVLARLLRFLIALALVALPVPLVLALL